MRTRMIGEIRRWLGEGARLKTDGEIGRASVANCGTRPDVVVGDIGGGTVELNNRCNVRECEAG